jgi:ABC-2 type transport system permease protein
LAMVFVSLIISKPDSPLATLLSLVPFFAPILMIGRLSVTDVPLWQITEPCAHGCHILRHTLGLG